MSMAMGALQSDSDYVLYIYTKGANTKLRVGLKQICVQRHNRKIYLRRMSFCNDSLNNEVPTMVAEEACIRDI